MQSAMNLHEPIRKRLQFRLNRIDLGFEVQCLLIETLDQFPSRQTSYLIRQGSMLQALASRRLSFSTLCSMRTS